jgi:hypothetical protein
MNRDQQLLEEAYQLIIEANRENFANQGIVFLKKGNKDLGCCIGVAHGKSIRVSKDLIERIKQIPNLKFYAEGSAAKRPQDEPGMMPFLQTNFTGAGIQKQSWDEITEDQDKGTANNKYNVVYVFMQHRYNKLINNYPNKRGSSGTMLQALADLDIEHHYPKNSPTSYEERLEWLTFHMKKAGFYNALNQRYNRRKLLKIMDEMELSVYPKGQQFPNTSTYFGKMAHKLEEERNQTIYNLMTQGGCCFAGAGHLIELKQQFPNLEIICGENIK